MSLRRQNWVYLVWALIAAFATMTAGCNERSEAASQWLERVETTHQRAEAAMAREAYDDARQVLARAAEQPAPTSVARSHERVVRQDLYYRLSELELAQGRFEEAERWAEAGLNLGRGNDVFTANLLRASGRAKEALGRELDAAECYHEALLIIEIEMEALLEAESNATSESE